MAPSPPSTPRRSASSLRPALIPPVPGAAAAIGAADAAALPRAAPRRLLRALVVALVASGVVGAAIGLWFGWLDDRFLPKRWGVVEEGKIYRSGQIHEVLVESTLKSNGIDVIVDLAADDCTASRAESAAAAKLGIETVQLPLHGDGTGEIERYAQAISRMVEAEREGRQVLVHCVAGGSRTGGVVAMYRILVEGWSPELARDEMLSYGWKPSKSDLAGYLDRNMETLARRLVELGAIARVPDPIPHFPFLPER